MAKRERDKREQKTEEGRKGLLFTVLTLPFVILSALLISALVSFVIEAAGIAFDWWDEPGVLHSQKMVEQEIYYLNDRLEKNILEPLTGVTVQDAFEKTVGNVAKFINWIGLGSYGKSQADGGFGAYIGAAANMIILTCIRFLVFIFALVLYVLFGWVGLSIGLLERDKRKAGGGRESGTIFQLARACVPISIALPLFLYLTWPNSIDPVWIMFPFAAGFGLAVAYMAASYKKYI
jgi:hypothetical protein